MLCHHFIHLCAHCADGAKGASCALKDHPKLRAVQLSEFLFGQIGKILSLIPNIAACHDAAAAKQSHGGFQKCGFPAATLSNDAEDLSPFQRKAHILHGWDAIIRNVHMFISQ